VVLTDVDGQVVSSLLEVDVPLLRSLIEGSQRPQ